jgi:hypothetical protein
MSDPIHFDTVWFSTDAQFAAFDEAFRNASWFARAIGRYPVRRGAAYTTMLLPWIRIPIVLVAAGRFDIAEGRASFAAGRRAGARRNVLTNLAFVLTPPEIKSLEAHLQKSPVDPAFSLTWTHVETTREPPLDSFYLSVGGRNAFAMGRYRREGLALREALQRLRDMAPTLAPASAFR